MIFVLLDIRGYDELDEYVNDCEHIRNLEIINKSGAPKHPLYQKNTAQITDFDMEAYIETLV